MKLGSPLGRVLCPKMGIWVSSRGEEIKRLHFFKGGARGKLAKIREEFPFETQVFDKYLREEGREIRDLRNNKRKRRVYQPNRTGKCRWAGVLLTNFCAVCLGKIKVILESHSMTRQIV